LQLKNPCIKKNKYKDLIIQFEYGYLSIFFVHY
jgi:hypothetical protein